MSANPAPTWPPESASRPWSIPTNGNGKVAPDLRHPTLPGWDSSQETAVAIRPETALGRAFDKLVRSGDNLWSLLRHSFDAVWQAKIGPTRIEGTVSLLRELGPEAGSQKREIPQETPFGAWWALIHPDDIEPARRALDNTLRTGEDFRAEYRLLHNDGTVTWFEDYGTVVEFSGGTPVALVGTARNITQFRQMEKDLSKAGRQLEQFGSRAEKKFPMPGALLDRGSEWSDIVGKSPALTGVLEKVRHVAITNSVVLITGETGTGKDLIARAIHAGSERRDHPLVAVNCAALPPTLIESELFGHEKGAFTGAAARRVGRFEFAHNGTIFLDEIGEMPADLQAKLLRVLQAGEFERVGSCQTLRVDVRVIAATNTDLTEAVKSGSFRSDLFYRLNVFPIKVPPLRERREDIPLLVSYLAEKKGQEMKRPIERIPASVMETLSACDWPGNVRELENIVERALIISRGPVLSLQGVFTPIAPTPAVNLTHPAVQTGASDAPHQTLREVERDEIIRVCEACQWKIKGRGAAADRLGINPSTLYFRMKKLGISRPALDGLAPPAATS